jgi:hypothetical protein
VGVDVGEADAARLKELNLGAGLGFDFRVVDAASEKPLGEGAKLRMEAAGRRIRERGELRSGSNGLAIDENDMASDTEAGGGFRNLDRLIRTDRARHERGAGEHACLVQLEDGAIDAGSEAEVVGVYDESRHSSV